MSKKHRQAKPQKAPTPAPAPTLVVPDVPSRTKCPACEEHAPDCERERRLDRREAIRTWAYVIAAVAALAVFFVAIFQWDAMRGQLTLGQDQLAATRAQLRAVVSLAEASGPASDVTVNVPFGINLVLKNTGPTAAQEMAVAVDLKGMPTDPSLKCVFLDLPRYDRPPRTQNESLGAGIEFRTGGAIRLPDDALGKEVAGMINSGQAVFQVAAKATYKDVFGREWVDRYCREMGKERGAFYTTDCLDRCPGRRDYWPPP